MKNYREPEIEVTSFNVEDIVTLSVTTKVATVADYADSNGFQKVENGYTLSE